MAIINFIPASSFKGTIKYITRDAKLREGQKPAAYITGINCSSDPQEAIRDWQMTKLAYKKTDGRSAIHLVQSFPAGEVTAEEAHKLAIEYVKKCPKFDGFEIIIATHTDQKNGNTHNHIAWNSVNAETGKKWHLDPEELAELKEINNQICIEHGLSVPEKGKTIKKETRDEPVANNRKAYAILEAADNEKLESYIKEIGVKVMEAAENAISKEDFIRILKAQGVGVTWTDDRKYITFADLKRKAKKETKYKVRNKRLSQYYNISFEKGDLENGFKANATRIAEEERARKQLDSRINGSLGTVQSGKQQPATGIAGKGAGSQQFAAGKQQSDGQVSGSLQKNRELSKLGLGAGEITANQAERKRGLRDEQKADAAAKELAAAERAEQKRLREQQKAAGKAEKGAGRQGKQPAKPYRGR